MSPQTRVHVAYSPVVIDGRWFFARTEGDAVKRLRGCAVCEGHFTPGDAALHYVMTEPPAAGTGHEMQ